MAEYTFTINGKDYKVTVKSIESNIAEIEMNDKTFKVNIKELGTKQPKREVRRTVVQEKKEPVQKKVTGTTQITAPLPGVILNILVREGDTVSTGQDVLIMEAMKMENSIQSPYAGTVKKIAVHKEDAVQEGDLLIEIGG